MIWSDPFTREVRVSNPFSIQTAAFVFGADEQMKLARMGRVVWPVTSYLAAEPGVRPSTIGLDGFDETNMYGGLLGWRKRRCARRSPEASLVDTTACVAGEASGNMVRGVRRIVDVLPRANSPWRGVSSRP
ncbi:MAG: hypothetical protein SFX73_30705 [Kofleriaceae bacterium]|nr:hypothetical protein [Kofleriaceae bacterium]